MTRVVHVIIFIGYRYNFGDENSPVINIDMRCRLQLVNPFNEVVGMDNPGYDQYSII